MDAIKDYIKAIYQNSNNTTLLNLVINQMISFYFNELLIKKTTTFNNLIHPIFSMK